jgi:MFS transporter, ACS family, glucarate transporter
LIFFLASFASWLLYLHRYAWGVIRPDVRREHPDLTPVDLGTLDSAFNVTYALGQIPGGVAGDYFGPRLVMSVLALAWSGTAIAVGWAGGFYQLFAARAGFGLAQAGVYPVLNKMTRTWFPLATRTSVQGIVTAMGRVGAACAPVILATCLMGVLGLSWRTALYIISAPGVILAVVFWILVRDTPRQHPWTNPAEQQLLADDVRAPAPGDRPGLQLNRATIFSLTMLLLYAFTSTFQDQFYVNWLFTFLREGRNLDVATSGLFAPLPFLGGAIGGIVGGVINDALIRRWGNRRWARSSVGFTGKLMAATLVLVAMQVADGRLAMFVLLAARVFGDWSLPTQWGAITDMGGRSAATLFGLVNMVGVIGAVVAGPVFGWLEQEFQWEGILYGVATMCAAAALCWLFIDCTRRVVRE